MLLHYANSLPIDQFNSSFFQPSERNAKIFKDQRINEYEKQYKYYLTSFTLKRQVTSVSKDN